MKRTPARILTPLAFGAAVFSTAWAASAEEEALLPPDILLLIDTSGSMGLTTVRDPSDPSKYAAPQCATYPAASPVDMNATDFSGDTPPDRWSILVKVLTGKVTGHSCSAQPRASAEFKSEFGLGTTSPGANYVPYDAGYYMPYNRIVATSGGEFCTPAPSWDADIRQQLMNNAVKWPSNDGGGPIYWRNMADDFADMPYCSFPTQDTDGIIDMNQQSARFGVMTFDSLPHWLVGTNKLIGTGVVTGSNPPEASYPSGIGDTWSYFPNWRTDPSTGYGTGWPGGCNEANPLLEVGARNPAAPPWEGRLIDFGDPTAGTDEIIRNNERVQQALLSVRPYGATPIAGLLEDAKYFLLQDDTELKEGNKGYFWGGAADKTAEDTNRCRKRYVVLITDGGPNLDLRPDCSYNSLTPPGQCPYATPEQTAQELANVGIPTYVVGFSLATAGGTSTCTDLLQGTDPCGPAALTSCTDGPCATGQCAYGYCIDTPNKETLAACCTIKGIADAGGTEAQFAEDEGSLKDALDFIINQTDKVTQTDTLPVFAAGSALYTAGNQGFQAAEFLTSSKPVVRNMEEGNLSRKRWVCDPVTNGPPVPNLRDLSTVTGDSFDDNLDAFRGQRKVYTVVAETATNGKILSDRTVRPWYNESTGDGLGKVGISAGSSTTKMVTGQASSFASLVDAKALLGSTACTTNCCFATPTDPAPLATTCRTRFLNMELGLAAGDPDIEHIRSSALAAIQTTPILAGPPDDYLRDESYLYFQTIMKAREPVLYVPTVDGQLHAFGITRLTNELNEFWTFMPPAVLPRIGSQFPDRYASTTRALLDGPIVVRDVAGKVEPGDSGRFLQRTAADAKNPSATTTRWHTILVGAFGTSPGYYAMDVTWPDATQTPPTGYTAGPRFLWQLTTDSNGLPLFGNRSAPPTITTLFFKMPGELTVAEHAVAILPGGYGGERTNTLENVTFTSAATGKVDDRLTVRTQTNAYAPSSGTDEDVLKLAGARSLTIVRLDTGEVVRTFRRGAKGVAPVATDMQAPAELYTQDRITNAPFDAPVVGHVIAYPNGAGAVSDRAYVGDAEGRLWRVDLSSADPGDWAVDLFHDTYPASGLDFGAHGTGPIETPPILSTDPLGRVTIAISTGDQHTITETGEYNVWSLTEIKDAGIAKARVNWFLSSDNAKNPATTDTPDPMSVKSTDPAYAENINHFDNGERVTGPMMLFNSVLYFTTYSPEDAACTPGWSHLWGVHYITPKIDPDTGVQGPPKDGPDPQLDQSSPADGATGAPPDEPKILVRPVATGASFGPGITAKPACYTKEDVAGDPFLGFGTHSSITGVTPTQYQLVIQGSGTGTDTPTNVFRQNLFPPLGGGRIDSWASILD